MIKAAILFALVALASAAPRISRPQLDGRIVGGNLVNIQDHPYQVSLRSGGSHICGGSIINANTVLTAAHCVRGASVSSISFRAGSSIHNSGGTTHQASSILIHPSYNQNTMDYDYAIVKVSTAFGSGAASIGLQSAEVSVGSASVVSGWGYTSEGGSLSTQLRAVTVPIVSDSSCNAAYGGITARMICAGETAGGKDSCQGDSGGPLRVGSLLTGVVSWGYGCARPNYPGVYSKVLPVRSWITSNS